MKILLWKCPKCGATSRAVASGGSWEQIGILCTKDQTLVKPSLEADVGSILWLENDLGREKDLELRILPNAS